METTHEASPILGFLFVAAIAVGILLIQRFIKNRNRKKASLALEKAHNEGNIHDHDYEDFKKYILRGVNLPYFYIALSQSIQINKRFKQLAAKYGQEIAERIINSRYWIGMTPEHLVDAKGEPTKIETEQLKTKTKEIYIYGNKSSGDYFVFENGEATKIVDR